MNGELHFKAWCVTLLYIHTSLWKKLPVWSEILQMKCFIQNLLWNGPFDLAYLSVLGLRNSGSEKVVYTPRFYNKSKVESSAHLSHGGSYLLRVICGDTLPFRKVQQLSLSTEVMRWLDSEGEEQVMPWTGSIIYSAFQILASLGRLGSKRRACQLLSLLSLLCSHEREDQHVAATWTSEPSLSLTSSWSNMKISGHVLHSFY